jgi:hypothetical protein
MIRVSGRYLERPDADPDARELWHNLHEMTLRVAGHVSDSELLRIRSYLLEGEWLMAGVYLEAIAIGYEVMLPTQGLNNLPRRVTEPGWKTGRPLPTASFETVLPLWNYTFTPFPPQFMGSGASLDLADVSNGRPDIDPQQRFNLYGGFNSALTPGLGADDGVIGIWQSWRSGPDLDSPVRRVHVVELDPKASATDYTRHAEFELRTSVEGDKEPLVEAYLQGWEVPEYQRKARDNGVLLWARTPGEVILTQIPGEGVQIEGTGYSTNGRTVWQGAPTAPSTVDGVGIFRARLALRKAGLLP